ncbi:MAG: hypothetical protein HKN20_08795 [Gemmatimonadetes bacterium]|nr:hypothetical protein [Gemmatimonadota bacterium]
MRPRILILFPLLIVYALAGCGDDENPLAKNETFTGRWVSETAVGITFFWELAETDAGVKGNLYQELSSDLRGPMPIRDATRSGDRIRFSVVDEEAVLVIGGALVSLDSLYIDATLASNSFLEMNGTFCLLDTCVTERFPAFRQQVGF